MAPPRPPRSPPSSTMSDHMSSAPPRPTNGDIHTPNANLPPSSIDTKPMTVNRKKQKRRQKQAARLAAERQSENGVVPPDAADRNGLGPAGPGSHISEELDIDHSVNGDAYHDDELDAFSAHHDFQPDTNGPDDQKSTSRKSKKKKGKKNRANSQTLGDESPTPLSTPSVCMTHPLPPPLPPHLGPRTIVKPSKDRSIWNTSTQEERENIKTFWLELGEEERRQLVKVEKDAVLKKMKEQQKHSCSCTVCGRKRTAIEEELEVLYDAYYEELEQYANNNQGSFEKGAPIVPPPRLYQPPLRSPGQHTRTHGQYHPSRGRIHELPEDDDEDLEDDYDEDDEDDEPYSDDDFEDEETRAARADFFAFGNSLTVKDGILTVADDLLKNDGKHFIDMMEQLAERRMQREEDTQYGIAAAHQSLHSGHNHGPYDDEDYDDEEDDDYDSQEEEDYEEDEMVCPGVNYFPDNMLQCKLTHCSQDAMTEEQRMEEGRRMFQIFAARMFEQRVLTAYREKVAEQRQQKLIEELMEEQTRNEQRNAKKAREAEKRKEKKRLQKQAKDEEKARREAEKAAEEAAAKAEHERKLEEQKKKREEQRKKREAERKAQEEERARKEAEKQRRLREERERQADAERKQREQKEQEKRRREETRRKEREEREAREKKAKEERERKVREEQAKKAGQETQERKRSSQQGPVPIASTMHFPGLPGHLQSPHYQSATPIVPKAPTPVKPRQPSQQGSHTSSPRSQPASTEPSQVSISPRSMAPSQSSGASSVTSKQGYAHQPMLHHPQPSTPLSPLGSIGRSFPPGFSNGLPPNPPGLAGIVPRPPIGHELPTYPPHSTPLMSQLRGFTAPNGIPVPPPGINGARPIPPGRGFPLDPGHSLAFHSQQPLSGPFATQPGGLAHGHTRQPSGSFERSPLDSHAQPFSISRPSPIKRPSSTQQEQGEPNHAMQRHMDSLSAQLGSSALLDDTDIPFTSNLSQSLPGATAPGALPGPARASFAAPSLFPDPLSAPKHTNFPINPGVGGSTWGAQLPFGASAFPGASTWGTVHGGGWSNNAFGSGGHHRAHTSRPVAIRLLVIQACKQLNTMSPSKGAAGYHDVNHVLRQVDQLRPPNEPSISLKEMLDICDTEGNTQNGGGSFLIKNDETGEYVKFESDTNSTASGHRGSIVPGEIGSPVPSSSIPAFGGIGSTPSVLRQFSSPPTGF
ncbi:salt tolerance down-regulator-domain-containing protein [Aspergillus pseudonomiae]|uniref:Stress response protein NST1 n=1 Tax=Aspergillus pseudonomiae TaxID=1506151 RepID=A0A5N7CX63_9EURO|nr:salt tolerance down-regulator-domain-containing protein [Aspergillus pseudonomiae]KAB8255231.1 salt tolerance down-regulator-domain-containing protein [Aspergillus pseudonomiae]KAE8398770.1 salt tolerance down-regulator-domain-containing protein [Aspergillus pseudonomiae]